MSELMEALTKGKNGAKPKMPDDDEGGNDAAIDEAFADLKSALDSGDAKAGSAALRALRDLIED